MSRERGNALQNALAAYLRRWWPHAESAGSGRNGRDVLGTPGVWWENKTSGTRLRPGEFVRQAADSAPLGELPVVVWWPPGVGAKSPGKAIAMISLPHFMGLLEICELAPPPTSTASVTLASLSEPPSSLSPMSGPSPSPSALAPPAATLSTPPESSPPASAPPAATPESSSTPPPALRIIRGELWIVN